MPEPLEPADSPASKDTEPKKERDDRSRRRDRSRYGDELPSGTFRIPRV